MAVIEERERRIVGGVDTHKDLHVAAVVDEQDRVIETRCFATTRQGYRQMLAWMRSFGELQRIGIKSSGTHRPENEGLCRSSDRRGAFQTRRHSNLEALSRQRGLHAHHAAAKGNQRHANRRLTNR